MSSRWQAVAGLGQSVWYDNVARPALAEGHLARLVREDGVTGGTSNPSIFAQAVLESGLYDEEIRAAPASDSDAKVFERCAVGDIQQACDLLRPVWERTGGADGYISIEEEAALAFEGASAARGRAGLRGRLGRTARARAARARRPAQRADQDPIDRGRRRGVPPPDPRGPEHQHDAALLGRALPADRPALRRCARRARRGGRGRARDRLGGELLRLAR